MAGMGVENLMVSQSANASCTCAYIWGSVLHTCYAGSEMHISDWRKGAVTECGVQFMT